MKTNVLIVDQALEFGGSIVSTANLIRAMDRKKYNFVFMSSTSENLIRTKLRELGDKTEVIIARKQIHYNNTNKFFQKWRNSPNKNIHNVSVILFYLARIVLNSNYMLQVARAIRRHNIDIVQLNNYMDDEVSIVCKFFRVKQIAYLRGYTPLSKIQRKLFMPSIDYFFSVSEFVRQLAIEDGVDKDKIVVATPPAIPEMVTPEKLTQLKKRYKLPDDETRIGIFGRIVTWKGQKEFILAAIEVLQRFPKTYFFIVGMTTDGALAYNEQLLRIIGEAEIEDRVVFTGYVENVYDYYALMDIVVHASIEPEPSGRVIFEAMSQGKPVIASIHGGPKEFIDDGVDGYLANPQETEALTSRLVSLIESKSMADQVGSAARAKIEKRYNKQAYAKRIEVYYQKALPKKPRTIACGT